MTDTSNDTTTTEPTPLDISELLAATPQIIAPASDQAVTTGLSYSAVTDLRYSDADHTRINATVTFDLLGAVPFTCCPKDAEAHSVEIYNRIMAGDFGDIADYAAPVYSAEYLAAKARAWRDTQMSDTQWLVDRHRDEVADGVNPTLTDDQYKALQVYRQALRDWPAAEDFPADSSKPAAPDWLAAAEAEASA